MSRRWRRFLWRITLAALLGVVFGVLPVPEMLQALQLPIIVIAVVCYTGKLLYDTLFFDHYWP